MPVPFHPISWNILHYNQADRAVQTQMPQEGPFNGPVMQKNPSVMSEVAGYSTGGVKTYEQIAVETMTN